MICAVIDLGSNTIRLCIYEYSGNDVKSLLQRKTMAGLINYVENEILSKKGILKAGDILNEYKEILRNFKVDESNIFVFATASLRNIVNTKEAIDEIRKLTGLQIELLSGEEEATLDFSGATHFIDMTEGVLVDIGGGSTEIVIFKDKKIVKASSMPIGSLNSYVLNVKKIIPKEDERKAIKQRVIENLELLELERSPIKTICGVGGTIRAFAKLESGMNNMGKDGKIPVSEIKEILKLINNSHKSTLKPVLQNIPDRIHTIIPGMIILDTVARYFDSKEIIVSNYGIREGYLYDRILKDKEEVPPLAAE